MSAFNVGAGSERIEVSWFDFAHHDKLGFKLKCKQPPLPSPKRGNQGRKPAQKRGALHAGMTGGEGERAMVLLLRGFVYVAGFGDIEVA